MGSDERDKMRDDVVGSEPILCCIWSVRCRVNKCSVGEVGDIAHADGSYFR